MRLFIHTVSGISDYEDCLSLEPGGFGNEKAHGELEMVSKQGMKPSEYLAYKYWFKRSK